MTSFSSYDPATGAKVWEGVSATPSEIDHAVKLAQEAFLLWSDTPFKERVRILESFRETLAVRKTEFAEAISKETGKPFWESQLEVASMINKVNLSVEAYSKRCPETAREQHPYLSVTRHKPHGVLAVLGPFNFPGHLPNGHIVPALLAGNTVIYKPSELAPLTGELTLKFWQAAGLPPGVLQVIQGAKEAGQAIVEHPRIDGLLFTGSWPTGKFLSEQFAKAPYKILALEMGGNNPLVVSQISNPVSAAYLTIQSAYLTSGQRCTCARRLIVKDGNNQFLDHLFEMIKTIKIGAYTERPEPFMGPVISNAAAEKLLSAQEILKSKGGTPLVEMQSLKPGTAFLSPGLIDVTHVKERPDEELFGPLLQLIRVKDFPAAIEEANQTTYGLAAGLLSDSRQEYETFYKRVKAGVINWNAQLTGASSAAPFGGVGRSGNHRPSAFYAADYCAYPVASLEAPVLAQPNTLTPGIKI